MLPHQSDYVSHIALDIGGSLIKLVYFSMDEDGPEEAGAKEQGHAVHHHHVGGQWAWVGGLLVAGGERHDAGRQPVIM